MGRFDALTQLDNQPVYQSPSLIREAVRQPETPQAGNPEIQKAGNHENPKGRLPEIPKAGMPESNFSGKREIMKTRKPETLPFVKAEKYSTQLAPSMIKQIKQYAIEHDIKDYEVVQAAIKDYLARNK
jgi:hypothetical protein